jgi:hypothetical protein
MNPTLERVREKVLAAIPAEEIGDREYAMHCNRCECDLSGRLELTLEDVLRALPESSLLISAKGHFYEAYGPNGAISLKGRWELGKDLDSQPLPALEFLDSALGS